MSWWNWLIVAVVVIGAAGYALLRVIDRRQANRLRKHGVPVIAAVVQVNDRAFREASKWETAPPGQFIITFDPAVQQPKAFLPLLAARMMNLKGTQPTDPDEQAVAKIVTDETYRFWQRIKLPQSFTGGPKVFVVYFDVYQGLLPGGRLASPWIECIATPGEKGDIMMLAAWNYFHPDSSLPSR
jgi:hypothetical protein